MYLLPAIDILGGKAVRLAKGDYDRVTVYHDDPAAQAQLFEEQGAAWLHVVDLDGARSGTPENIAIIERILKKTLLKVEVGGGVRSLDTIARLADAGVSRVVLGTSLVADPAFAEAAIAQYGRLLCAGIDAKGGEVAVAGWREGAGVAAEELARDVSALGFRHLVYTDIARDGMQTGVEAAAYAAMAEAFGRPVIASGGVAGVDDDIDVISDEAITPICRLKTDQLHSRNPRLHSDETLIALSISSATDPLAAKLIDHVNDLRGCDAFFSVILSATDEKLYRTLGINVCCEPKYEQHRYYHK